MPALGSPSSRGYLKGTHVPPLKPHLVQENVVFIVAPSPPPTKSPTSPGGEVLPGLLGADDMPGPGLMFGAWCQVGYDYFHSLQLLILGWDGAHLIGDLVAFHRDILPFHI